MAGAIPGVRDVPSTSGSDGQQNEGSAASTNPLQSAVQHGVASFRSKPAQSGVLLGSILLLLFLIISAWSPWWGFLSEDYTVQTRSGETSAHQVAQFMPLTAEVCTFEEGRKRTQDIDGVSCTSIQLVVVRKRLDYFRRAGGVAFTFIFMCTVVAIPGAFVSYVHRRGRLYYDIPEPLWFLRSKEATPIMFAAISFMSLLGWASYAGVVNSKLDKTVLIQQLTGSDSLKRAGYRAGFVLAILCSILAGGLAYLAYVYHDEGEAERAAQDAAMAHAVASGAAAPGQGIGQQVGMPAAMAATATMKTSTSGSDSTTAFPPAGIPPTAHQQVGAAAPAGGAGQNYAFSDVDNEDYEAGGGRSTINPVVESAGRGGVAAPDGEYREGHEQQQRSSHGADDADVGNPFGDEPAL